MLPNYNQEVIIVMTKVNSLANELQSYLLVVQSLATSPIHFKRDDVF